MMMLMCWTLPDAVGSEANETDTKATCLLREIVVKQGRHKSEAPSRGMCCEGQEVGALRVNAGN